MPSASAAAKSGDESRQSLPIKMARPSVIWAKAAPMSRTSATSRSSGATARTAEALKMRLGSLRVTRTHPTERAGTRLRLLANDQIDDGGERHELAVAAPPLRLTHVAGREGEVAVAQRHRDGDQIALLALRTGSGVLRHRGSSV